MKNLRKYGKSPYTVAIIHGGPGAPGAVAPVARELSKLTGVLEPLQTRDSLEGQVVELADVLKEHADLPVILIGHSWGAFLGFIVAARYPAMVRKLILVGSGPFEQKYADNIDGDRLTRLSEKERIEAINLIDAIDGASAGEKDRSMGRLGELFAKADTFDALPPEKEPDPLPVSEEINRKVWAGGKRLRVSGELLRMGEKIKCPVVAIHGDYDPHLAEGVRSPLSRVLKDFKFILLGKCGHEPWLERFARDRFYEILRDEIQ
ncbi:MAG: alpha/beta hydrolase [Chloroflexi bacterium RBG_16_56_11]|nr:MAG: alpha/beta hydrolase [Chloroflexi bacterium RBG_16_56_11]